ncbi:MAG: hypothetical protein ACREQ7_23830 [Candidatus Binatia bacterium]
MKDTPESIEHKFHTMLMARSGEERLKMGCSMHATARALVKASIAEGDPIAVKQALFLRFYGEEFEPQSRNRILGALRKAAGTGKSRAMANPTEKDVKS